MTHINQSQVKTWRRCQQQWDFRYGQKLVPVRRDRPMHLGSWVHAALESHYRDGDWHIGHQVYLDEYDKLFDEERELLDAKAGPLPVLVERIMESYLWHWRDESWEVVSVEQKWRIDYASGKGLIPLGGRLDLLVRDADGLLWVVDHKTTTIIPPETAFHAMDPQMILYPWAAKEVWNLDIAGVIYNYVRSKAPSVPKINQDGSLSKAKISTDYPTVLRFLQENNKAVDDYSELLDGLKGSSEFFRRYRLPREAAVTDRIIDETISTARDILDHTDTTRNVTRDCAQCSYQSLCRAELFGLDTDFERRRDFTIAVDEEEETGGDSSADELTDAEGADIG